MWNIIFENFCQMSEVKLAISKYAVHNSAGHFRIIVPINQYPILSCTYWLNCNASEFLQKQRTRQNNALTKDNFHK